MSESESESSNSSEVSPIEKAFLAKLDKFEKDGPYTKDMFIDLCKEMKTQKLDLELSDSLVEVIHKFSVEELVKLNDLDRHDKKYYSQGSDRSVSEIIIDATLNLTKEQILVFKDKIRPQDMFLSIIDKKAVDYTTFFKILELIKKHPAMLDS